MDPSQGIAGLKKLSAATDAEMTSAESRLKSFGANAMKIGVGGLAAGAFLTELGSKEQASAQQLDAAIESVGQSVDDYKDRIAKAGEEQAKFGHSQVDVNNALNTLTLSYGDTGKALDELQLTADLAAKKHIDLADAATMVAKAHGGAARLFKEFNIQVKTNTDGTKDYDGALRELQDKLSGQASAAADTFTGKLTALRTEVENQVAAFGQKYGPAILAVSAAMTAFGGIASGIAAIQGKLAASHAASADAATAQSAAEDELAASELLVTGNSAASVATLYEQAGAEAAVGAAAEEASIGMVPLIGGIALLGAAMAYGITHASDYSFSIEQMTTATNLNNEEVKKSAAVLSAATGGMEEFGKQAAAQSIPAAQRYADAMDKAGISSTDFRKGIDDQIATQRQLAADQKSSTDAINGTTEATKAQKDAMEQAGKAVQNYTGFISDLAGAMEKTYQGTVSQIKLHSSFEAGIDDLNKALWTNGKTLDDNTEAGRANIAAALTAGDSIAKLAEAKFQETHNTQDAINTASIYTAALDDQLKAAGLNKTQIEYMNAEMGLTPDQIATTFSNNAVEQQIVIGKYLDQLDKIPADQKTYIEALINQGAYDQANNKLNYLAGARVVPFYADVVSDPTLFRSSNIGGPRAGGGPVNYGTSYLVGEKGPELFTPGASGAITPTDVTAGLMGGSGHTFNIYETSPRETAVEVANRLRAEAMLSGV